MRKFPLRKVRPASQPRSSTAIATIFLPKFERTTWELDRQWAIQLNPLPLFSSRRKGFLQDSLCLVRLYTATGVTDKKCSQCKSGRPVSASIHLLDHHFKMFSSETFDFEQLNIFTSILLPTDINSSKAL